MYYRLQPSLAPVEPAEAGRDPSALIVGYIGPEELIGAIERFGFSDVTPEMCLADRDHYRNLVDVFEDYTFGLVSIVDVNSVYAPFDRLAFFIRKNLLLVVSIRDEDGNMREAFAGALRRYKPETVTLEKLIFAVLESTISHDAQGLARIEQAIGSLEEAVALSHADKSLSARIYEQKKQLLLLRGYYGQLIDLGEALEENENEIFEEDALHYFALLTAKAERLSDSVNLLCDELNQLRDALTASMDYRLNHIMEIFTIISGIFLPLTLLVGWYGMNFKNMPELESPYGYPLFIVLCVGLAVAGLVFFKKKKWF